MEDKVLDAMKKAGKPVRPGDVAKELGVDSKDVSKAIDALKKAGKIYSPKRCYYERKHMEHFRSENVSDVVQSEKPPRYRSRCACSAATPVSRRSFVTCNFSNTFNMKLRTGVLACFPACPGRL